ncbi:hypothetical protein [Alicyclobacillus sp. SO9]|uniref:hypothetical protein n=1 Tax=Alicyclobacillus sp. SO9 TaxID=2665646 RepID=UPI0018E8B97F|nr:hypothetical protein [Alicyclobacillus sp. SO9]QQE79485.1 hypothetical protein GI364_03025 [Alicyclobacillus sp. SO9]
MSGSVKFGFFVLALVSMTGLAIASVFMAQNRFYISTVIFVISFLLIGYGFRLRRRLMKQIDQEAN